jgi:hypothetical protein
MVYCTQVLVRVYTTCKYKYSISTKILFFGHLAVDPEDRTRICLKGDEDSKWMITLIGTN